MTFLWFVSSIAVFYLGYVTGSKKSRPPKLDEWWNDESANTSSSKKPKIDILMQEIKSNRITHEQAKISLNQMKNLNSETWNLIRKILK